MIFNLLFFCAYIVRSKQLIIKIVIVLLLNLNMHDQSFLFSFQWYYDLSTKIKKIMINSNVIYCSFTLEADIKFLMAKKQFMYLMKLKKFFCLRKTLKTRTTRCPRKNVPISLLRNIFSGTPCTKFFF